MDEPRPVQRAAVTEREPSPSEAGTQGSPDEWAAAGVGLGVKMGRYELTSFLGAGGMGIVFAARDPELDRMVAVKVLPSSDVSGSEGESRLRREGQTMARLAHENVIRVYDVGVAHGHPFVAMELIEGGTLGQWLARRPRSPGEILATFARAGRGLAAAHDAGLVHRDFKPSNVLVGDDGRVLVTDFGLARSLGAADGGTLASGSPPAPGATHSGKLAGTPAYMAPEQHAGGSVDARADQFSFCVALWQALYGAAPYAGKSAEDLASSTSSGVLTPPPAPAVGRVSGRMRAALERGLRPRASERFASMRDLLAALEAPATGGRAWRWAASLGAIAVLGVSAWTVVRSRSGALTRDPCATTLDPFAGVWDADAARAVQAAFVATRVPYAEASYREVARQLDARRGQWEAMRRESCEATRVRGVQSDTMMDVRSACLERHRTDIAAFVSELRAADADALRGAPQVVAGVGDPTRCGDVGTLARRTPLPAAPARRAAIAQVERDVAVARAHLLAGHPRDVIGRSEELIARARAAGYAPLVAEALAAAAEAHAQLENGDRAAALYREAILAADAGGDDALRFDYHVAAIRAAALRDRDADAAQDIQQSEALLARLGADPRRAANLARSRAYADWVAGRFVDAKRRSGEAAELFERIDPAGVELATTLHLRAIVLDELHEDTESLASEERALAIAERALGAQHPTVAKMLNTLGGALKRLGKNDEARRAYEKALAMTEATSGPQAALMGSILDNLGAMDLEAGNSDAAVATLRRSVNILEKAFGTQHQRTIMALGRLGGALSQAGHAAEAQATLERAVAISTKLGRDTLSASDSHKALGKHYLRVKQPARARAEFAEALRAVEASQGAGSVLRAPPLKSLGDAELALGQRAAAVTAYQSALAAMGEATQFPKLRGEIQEALARLAAARP